MKPAYWLSVLCVATGCVQGTSPMSDGGADVVEQEAGRERGPFATRVTRFEPGPPGVTFGSDRMPGVVLGAPRGGGEYTGSTDVVSLGRGGVVCVEFEDVNIVDGPGPDFIVFENAFRVRGGQAIWQELAEISVSADGTNWTVFPCDVQSPMLTHCAGQNPVYSSPDNVIPPTDVAMAGGDAFDLATMGLQQARFVCVRDLASQDPAGVTTGFDLDAIAAVHATQR